MKIELHEITIREIAENYVDNQEEGVMGYNGLLNIRPKYQREFVYDSVKQDAVINTVSKNYPLNIMYWVKNDDGSFEVLDGQQRTISFCRYINNDFSFNGKYFNNLTQTEKDIILNYKCSIYFCEGNDLEKLEWFKVINIAGERLTEQELRNVVYTGSWLTSAKSKFSKTGCAAYNLAKDYVSGNPLRQDYLEKVLSWINNGDIEGYMSVHQHDPNANEIWIYFLNVIEWVKNTFTKYRSEMKGIEWGELYNKFGTQIFDTVALENEIKRLMEDDDVTKKKGIYHYVLTRKEKYLNIRAFTESQKRTVYERQNGICPVCKGVFGLSEMEGDHITPWCDGGKTEIQNCQMLCKECNRRKSNI